MGKAIFAAALILMTAGLAASACGGGGGEKEKPASSGAAQVKMEEHDFYFKPDKLTDETGKAIALELENEGTVAHTFTIDELNVDKVLQPGEKATVSVKPTASGTLAFYCRIHRTSNGMEGTLTVSAASGGLPGY